MSVAELEGVQSLSPAAIGSDSSWFPENFDARAREIAFVRTDEKTLGSHPFLDHRWKRDGAPRVRIRTDQLHAMLAAKTQEPLNVIWHTGFCCSTLLAKALNASAHTLSLCEPQVLVSVADARRADLLPPNGSAPSIPALLFDLLARPFGCGSTITVKPAPAANILLRDAITRPSTRHLLLYSDCREFLIAVAKLGEEGRKYVRRMFGLLLADGHRQFHWTPAKLLSLTDLEIASLVWHMQIAEFRAALVPAIGPSAATLNCDAFEKQPETVLAAIIAFLQLKPLEGATSGTMKRSIFEQNAKQPGEPYDFRMRRDEHEKVAKHLGGDLDHVLAWSYGLCPSAPRDKPLPNPLVSYRNLVEA